MLSQLQKIGKLCEEGKSRLLCFRGSDRYPLVKNPHIVSTFAGAALSGLLDGQLKSDSDIRIISGNVLT